MHSVIEENIAEHSDEVTVISHALCEIGKEYFGKTYDLEKVLLYARLVVQGEAALCGGGTEVAEVASAVGCGLDNQSVEG